MHPTDELIPIRKKLRMSGVLGTLELRTRQAVDDDLSHSEFLLRLLTDEVERRESKDELLASAALDRLLHHAHVLEIAGSSYRNPPRGRDGKGRQGAAELTFDILSGAALDPFRRAGGSILGPP